ncbi:hypothetical protein CVD25_10190 [Bacillus canaveralius]|uniref:Carbon monoxide dehydrogenase n=1 Tax=Bacillus canaveralius TaxID=1403243 RepID=A0A2N5GMC9_9BACI|nr:SRPBCC domain-containing protein [Bacillus canaveralius]PLR82995.1 hypothetical protein CU635_11010 [Bacillus canaveralius]PLR97001.1 hypothetical protein CVD25_10190 [Bacillus canaveralius]
MRIEHTIQLKAEPEVVWDWVSAIERVADCIPGVEDMTAIQPGKQYNALAKDRVGPFKVSFPMELTLEESEKPKMTIKASGQDKFTKTHVQLEMTVRVDSSSTGSGSEVNLNLNYHMKGKLATLGQGMINRKFMEKVDAFTVNLTEVLEGGDGNARVL